jgi:hypothetical protein
MARAGIFQHTTFQSVRIFQYKVLSHQGYFSTKPSASKDIPVQNIQSVRREFEGRKKVEGKKEGN